MIDLSAALRLTGITPGWVGEFLAHPVEFRSLLKRQYLAAARVIHPDAGGHLPISKSIGNITKAFQALEKATDEELVAAMRSYVDVYAMPTRQTVSLLDDLKRQNEGLEQQKAALEQRMQDMEINAGKAVSMDVELLMAVLRTPTRMITAFEDEGDLIHIRDLYRRAFYVPIGNKVKDLGDGKTESELISQMCYVDDTGQIFNDDVTLTTQTLDTFDAQRRLVGRMHKKLPKFMHEIRSGAIGPTGVVIGFTTDKIVSDSDGDIPIYSPYSGHSGCYARVVGSTQLLHIYSNNVEVQSVYHQEEWTAAGSLGRPHELAVFSIGPTDAPDEGGIKYQVAYIRDWLEIKENAE